MTVYKCNKCKCNCNVIVYNRKRIVSKDILLQCHRKLNFADWKEVKEK